LTNYAVNLSNNRKMKNKGKVPYNLTGESQPGRCCESIK